jgi:hypothetical protein
MLNPIFQAGYDFGYRSDASLPPFFGLQLSSPAAVKEGGKEVRETGWGRTDFHPVPSTQHSACLKIVAKALDRMQNTVY